MADEPKRYVIGDGGHGRLIAALVGGQVLGVEDGIPDDGSLFLGVGDIDNRRRIYGRYRGRIVAVVDRSHNIARTTKGMVAIQALAGVTVQPGCEIGENVLLNTGCQIDHDCTIGDHCVISPAAVLCGNVTLGEGCFIGAGAIIVQGVTLEPETFVPSGTLVCGSDDFRMPQRVLQNGRAAPAEKGKSGIFNQPPDRPLASAGYSCLRPNPDAQSVPAST